MCSVQWYPTGCAYIQMLAVISLTERRLFQTLTNMHTPTQHYSRGISTSPFIISGLAFPSFPVPAQDTDEGRTETAEPVLFGIETGVIVGGGCDVWRRTSRFLIGDMPPKGRPKAIFLVW